MRKKVLIGVAIAAALVVGVGAAGAAKIDHGILPGAMNGVNHAVGKNGALKPNSAGHRQIVNHSISCEKLSWDLIHTLCGSVKTYTGPMGPTGANGAPGSAGKDGSTGANGTNGANGSKGDTGANGANGADGAKGDKGATGLTGATGAVGAPGATGPQGLPGLSGPQGPAGPAGAVGPTGPAGATGPAGPTGAAGQDAPAREYGVASVFVSRGGKDAVAWATYSTLLGSPVGDNTGGVFRFTCSTANAPCTIGVKAGIVSPNAGSGSVYSRLLVYRTSYDTGLFAGTCEYADGSGASATPFALVKSNPLSMTDVDVNIGGSADCGGPVATAGSVPVITVPSGYYDVHSTFLFPA